MYNHVINHVHFNKCCTMHTMCACVQAYVTLSYTLVKTCWQSIHVTCVYLCFHQDKQSNTPYKSICIIYVGNTTLLSPVLYNGPVKFFQPSLGSRNSTKSPGSNSKRPEVETRPVNKSGNRGWPWWPHQMYDIIWHNSLIHGKKWFMGRIPNYIKLGYGPL